MRYINLRLLTYLWSTVSGFDLASFSSLSSEHLCTIGHYGAIYIYFFCYILYFLVSELILVGLMLDLVQCCDLGFLTPKIVSKMCLVRC